MRDNGGHAVALRWSMEAIYDTAPGEVFWAASDVGWVVGHSYIVYAPLLAGATTVLYEGKPVGTPDPGAFWRVVAEHGVTTLFTAPTALRAIRKEDPEAAHLAGHDVSVAARAVPRRRAPGPGHLPLGQAHPRRAPRRRPLVADGDRLADRRELPGDRGAPREAGLADAARPRLRRARASTATARTCPRASPARSRSACRCRRGRSRRCGTTTSASSPRTSRPTRATTSPATAAHSTRTATSTSWGASTTSSTSPGTGSRPARWRRSSPAHPDVAECAVIGVPDELRGQLPFGLVVLKDGADRDPQELEAELVALVRRGDRRRRVLPHGARRRPAAEDALGEDPAQDAARDRRGRGSAGALDDRRPGRARRAHAGRAARGLSRRELHVVDEQVDLRRARPARSRTRRSR